MLTSGSARLLPRRRLAAAILLAVAHSWAPPRAEWTTVLQYAEAPYKPTSMAFGALVSNDILEQQHTFFAKLSDAAINKITDGPTWVYYRLTSSNPNTTEDPLFLRTPASTVFSDDLNSMGLTASELYFARPCHEDQFDWCDWVRMDDYLDTGEQDGCRRWFTDSRSLTDQVACYAQGQHILGQRCFSRGSECGYSMRTHVRLERYGQVAFEKTSFEPLLLDESTAMLTLEAEGSFYGGIHIGNVGFILPHNWRRVHHFSIGAFSDLEELDLSPWVSPDEGLFRGGFAFNDTGYLVPACIEPPGLCNTKVVAIRLPDGVNPYGIEVTAWDLGDTDVDLRGFWGGFAHDGLGYLVPHGGTLTPHGKLVRFSTTSSGVSLDVLDVEESVGEGGVGFAGGFVHMSEGGVPYGILVPHLNHVAVAVNLDTFADVQDFPLRDESYAEGFSYESWIYFLPFMEACSTVARVNFEDGQHDIIDIGAQFDGPVPPCNSWVGGFRDEFYGYMVPACADAGHPSQYVGRFKLAEFQSVEFFQMAGSEGGGSPNFQHGFTTEYLGYMIPQNGPLVRFELSTETDGPPSLIIPVMELSNWIQCTPRILHGGRSWTSGTPRGGDEYTDLVAAWDVCHREYATYHEVVRREDVYYLRSREDEWSCSSSECLTYLQYCPDPKYQAPEIMEFVRLTPHAVFPVACDVSVAALHGPSAELVDRVPQPEEPVYLDRPYTFTTLGTFAELSANAAIRQDVGIFYLRFENDAKLYAPDNPLWRLEASVPMHVYIDAWAGAEQISGCNSGAIGWARTSLEGASFLGQGPGVVYVKHFFAGEAVLLGACGYAGGLPLIFAVVQVGDCLRTPAPPPPPTELPSSAPTPEPTSAADPAEESLVNGPTPSPTFLSTTTDTTPQTDRNFEDTDTGAVAIKAAATLLAVLMVLFVVLALAKWYGPCGRIVGRCRRRPAVGQHTPSGAGSEDGGEAAGAPESTRSARDSTPLHTALASGTTSFRKWMAESTSGDPFGGMFGQENSAYKLPEGKKYHFFVSHKKQHRVYSNTSEQISISIKDALQVGGLIGFLDIDNLTRISEEELRKAVIASCSIVVVLNDETVDSRWCRLEWEVAAEHDIPTVCIVDMEKFQKQALLRQVAEVCPHLMEHQWLDYTYQSRERSMKSLARWMNTMMRRYHHRKSPPSAALSVTSGAEVKSRESVHRHGGSDDTLPSATAAVVATEHVKLEVGTPEVTSASTDFAAVSSTASSVKGSSSSASDPARGSGRSEPTPKKKRWQKHAGHACQESAASTDRLASPDQPSRGRFDTYDEMLRTYFASIVASGDGLPSIDTE